jgi:hypothetical protein
VLDSKQARKGIVKEAYQALPRNEVKDMEIDGLMIPRRVTAKMGASIKANTCH